MGYNTRYTLEVAAAPGHPAIGAVCIGAVIESLQQEQDFLGDAFEFSEQGPAESEAMKWYEHEADLKNVSRVMPYLLLTLRGVGQEPEDQWVKYFLKGRMQVAKAQITFEEFDQAKLK